MSSSRTLPVSEGQFLFRHLKAEGVQHTITGAGDAFFGGLVSGIYKWGLPTTEEEMSRLARVASAHGELPAACVKCQSTTSLSPVWHFGRGRLLRSPRRFACGRQCAADARAGAGARRLLSRDYGGGCMAWRAWGAAPKGPPAYGGAQQRAGDGRALVHVHQIALQQADLPPGHAPPPRPPPCRGCKSLEAVRCQR